MTPGIGEAKILPQTVVDSVNLLNTSEIVTKIQETEATNDSYLTCAETVRIPYQIVSLLRTIEVIIKIGVPILLIVMGMIDFAKVVIGKPDEQMKKTKSAFMSRFISAILVFFVVSIVEMILPIINTDDKVIACTKCILLNKGTCEYINVEYPAPVVTPTPIVTPKPTPTSTPIPVSTPTPTPTEEVNPSPSPEE